VVGITDAFQMSTLGRGLYQPSSFRGGTAKTATAVA